MCSAAAHGQRDGGYPSARARAICSILEHGARNGRPHVAKSLLFVRVAAIESMVRDPVRGTESCASGDGPVRRGVCLVERRFACRRSRCQWPAGHGLVAQALDRGMLGRRAKVGGSRPRRGCHSQSHPHGVSLRRPGVRRGSRAEARTKVGGAARWPPEESRSGYNASAAGGLGACVRSE